MKLSELKALRPDVWDVFKSEVISVDGIESLDKSILEDDELPCVVVFAKTRQGVNAWYAINDNSDFTLFDRWMKDNRPKESEPIEHEQPVKRITITGDGERWNVTYEGVDVVDIIAAIESAKISLILKSLGK